MHLKNLFAIIAVSSAALVMISCSKGGSSTGGGNTPPPPPPAAKSLKVTLDKSQIFADNWETVTATVTDENNNDVTASSALYFNNASGGSSFWTDVPGTYQVKATRSGVTSPTVSLTVTDPGPSPFSQKIIVEDYTGTWCGHCPRVGIKLEDYVNNGHPDCIVIANHGPSNDPFTFSSHSTLANAFLTPPVGYPSVVVDRDFKWSENISQLDGQFINRRPPVGLALQTSVSGSTINVTAKVKFDVTTNVGLRLVAYLLEDNQTYPQVNYGYYNLPNPIQSYVHNGILRKTALDLFGDAIPTASQVKGTTYEKTFTVNASGYVVSRCRIVAFVVQGTNNQGRKEKVVLNAQSVKAGLNKDFD